MMAMGSSLRGLSLVTMAIVGVIRDDGAHARTFAVVAVPAASEEADQAAGGGFAQGLQDVAQGIFGVGIVHKDMPLAARIRDALETAGHDGHLARGRRPWSPTGRRARRKRPWPPARSSR